MMWIYMTWLVPAVFATGLLGGICLFTWMRQRQSHGKNDNRELKEANKMLTRKVFVALAVIALAVACMVATDTGDVGADDLQLDKSLIDGTDGIKLIDPQPTPYPDPELIDPEPTPYLNPFVKWTR